jgi:aminoglycoside phosphotransferase (APT) family kinase protein
MTHDIRAVSARFQIYGDFAEAAPYGSGHINDTYAAVYRQSGAPVRYIHQRINERVFHDPIRLMENVARVTAHARLKLAQNGDADATRRALSLVPSRDGEPYVVDDLGNVWRTYLFIEGARTYDVIETREQAYAAALAFGAYQHLLADLPGGRLHETIPGFHDTRSRFDALQRAVAADTHNRALEAREEIAFVQARERDVDHLLARLERGELPERVTHNDTKLNNVMIDNETREGLCVIDLDTTMPGLAPYDFGDLVRTATSASAEDERDLSLVQVRLEMFEALVDGYLSRAAAFLTPAERSELAFAGTLITLETGIRFLTDHLQGDTYFKVKRPGHNLDRARAQFALVRSLEARMDEMAGYVERWTGEDDERALLRKAKS